MTTTPEVLCYQTPVPAWAAGATATAIDCPYSWGSDVWQLYRDGGHVGCMYDDGAGYRFAEGVNGWDLADDEVEEVSRA